MRILLATCAMLLFTPAALASVEDYCAAFAIDHANTGPREKSAWQLRHDNAQKACTEQFSIQQVVVEPKKKSKSVTPLPKPMVKKVVAVEPEVKKPVAKKLTPKAKLPESAEAAVAVVKIKPKLVAGSAAWNDYCKKKYVSFDEAKGTYQSKKGIERKCLVTAD